MLTAAYWISALLLAAVAVCWAYVLVQPGMLLAPVQAWVRLKWYNMPFYARNEAECTKLREKLESRGELDATQAHQLGMIRIQIAYERDLDTRWWWKPLWGCWACVSGQAGFWGYLFLFWHSYALLAHLGFAAITILFAALWRALYAWSQTI